MTIYDKVQPKQTTQQILDRKLSEIFQATVTARNANDSVLALLLALKEWRIEQAIKEARS